MMWQLYPETRTRGGTFADCPPHTWMGPAIEQPFTAASPLEESWILTDSGVHWGTGQVTTWIRSEERPDFSNLAPSAGSQGPRVLQSPFPRARSTMLGSQGTEACLSVIQSRILSRRLYLSFLCVLNPPFFSSECSASENVSEKI